ncbi:MAG: tryptophan-rich sensory protein [Alphaproteobacteria bacterium]|jgi:tryptophan-rich sensory protein|nr:tryptophan-rich sensory protein [Alphaproteobacteria bacterium]
MEKINNITNKYRLLYWIIFYQLISICLGIITKEGVNNWYNGLQKSLLTPKGYVFPIIWSCLYCILAIIGWYLWNHKYDKYARKMFALYIIQMILNWSWTPVFFKLHCPLISLIILLAMIIITLYLCLESWKTYRFIFYILIIYFAWICFAAYLNLIILLLN